MTPAGVPESPLPDHIARERALVLIHPRTARAISLRDSGASHSTISHAVGMGRSNLVRLLANGQKALDSILPLIQTGAFDIARWADSHPKLERQNALTYLAKVGADISDAASLPELRDLARRHIDSAVIISD